MNEQLEKLILLKGHTRLPNILVASAECSPLSKTGGLADVAGALPKSLISLGFDARVITPYHRVIKEKYASQVEHICHFQISLGWRSQYVGLEKLRLGELTVYLIDNEYYFGDRIYRGGLAEGEQYAYFQRAVLEAIPHMDFCPDVVHCNDWHTGMIPFLLKTQYADKPQGRMKTVFSIHNLAFQGKFGFDFVGDLLEVDSYYFNHYSIGHHDCANFLKAACVYADRINTVSPSYADEIRTPQFGEGMEGALIYRGKDLCGIINGLDTEFYDPANDDLIPCAFSSSDRSGKAECKRSLLHVLGLEGDENTPIIAMVTRMTAQKGFDLVLQAIDEIMESGAVFILLGTGDPGYENAMRGLEHKYRGRLCSYLSYSEPMAHRIYAGSDFLLMPSAFEPCGLSQMIAMRYGTLPIVHQVGGLKDTVSAYDPATGSGNGFSFSEFNSGAMMGAVRTALELYRSDRGTMEKLISRAMGGDYSFVPSAVEYGKLYISALDDAGGFVHRPFDEDFRSPLGAVECGSHVCLKLHAASYAGQAQLVIGGQSYPMRRDGEYFSVLFTAPGQPETLWYHFRLVGDVCYGADGVGTNNVRPFQLTVYSPDFQTPSWAEGRVMYQIFPDRWQRRGSAPEKGAAYHRRTGRRILMHKSWDEPVKWSEPDGSFYTPNDFYGGTLSGITESLPRLKEMGIGCIYLNPIFESDSNHRYNTGDYRSIDPILGTEAAFRRLCSAAKKLDIRIILDGVFSHTGDDSIYFNKYGRYPGTGAFQSRDSQYFSWYDFRSWPDDYRSWWGFRSLPEVDEENAGWQDFVLTGEDSVLKKWLAAGAGGYRLDVADELPDSVIELIRKTAKEKDSEALIIGEVWEDATTKVSYDVPRSYALGKGLDSVMNYPLRTAATDFALWRCDAFALRDFLLKQMLNYPPPMYRCLMNLMGSHDTVRLRSYLGSGGCDGSGMDRAAQAAFSLSPEEDELGRARQRLCAALQFALPGMPCVYYGDEEGMQGLRDPFCRAPYREGDAEMRRWYETLMHLRNENPDMLRGEAAFAAPDGDTLCVLRYLGSSAHIVALNRGEAKTLHLSPLDFRGLRKGTVLPPVPAISLGAMDAAIISL